MKHAGCPIQWLSVNQDAWLCILPSRQHLTHTEFGAQTKHPLSLLSPGCIAMRPRTPAPPAPHCAISHEPHTHCSFLRFTRMHNCATSHTGTTCSTVQDVGRLLRSSKSNGSSHQSFPCAGLHIALFSAHSPSPVAANASTRIDHHVASLDFLGGA